MTANQRYQDDNEGDLDLIDLETNLFWNRYYLETNGPKTERDIFFYFHYVTEVEPVSRTLGVFI